MILWGVIYPGAKLGLREIPMLRFTYLRILLAMVVFFVVSGRTQGFLLPRSLWFPLLRAGLAQTMFQLLLIAGLRGPLRATVLSCSLTPIAHRWLARYHRS